MGKFSTFPSSKEVLYRCAQVRNFNFVVDFFQASLIGTVVTKKEMTSLFHTKLKLDTFVAEAKVGKEKSVFRLNESGLGLADEFGLSSSSDWFPLNDVAKFVKSVTRTTRASKYVDVWKESVAALSTKQVWIGGIFGEIDAPVEVIIRRLALDESFIEGFLIECLIG